jgi:hypothetical protein
MRTAGTLVIGALLLFGCSNAPQQPQQTTQPAAQPGEKPPFVSVPELKDVMDAMIMEQADVLWTVSGPEDAPKDDDGWHKLDHAAIAMIETTKFLQISHLAKDQGEWQNKANNLITAVNHARASIKDKNADKLFEAGGEIEEACSGCHKVYYMED